MRKELMIKSKTALEVAASSVAGAAAAILGGFDQLLATLVVFVILDIITGLLYAVYNRNISSSVMYKGLVKKVGVFILTAVAVRLDMLMGTDILRNFVIGAFVGMEGVSILENWGKMGLPLPKPLQDALAQFNKANGGSNGTNQEVNQH